METGVDIGWLSGTCGTTLGLVPPLLDRADEGSADDQTADDPGSAAPLEAQAHTAHRPTWNCLSCARPWPCPAARMNLVLQHEQHVLARIMVAYLYQAARDRGFPEGELFERFVRWTYREWRTERPSLPGWPRAS
jgi:hypothetical protein